VTTHTVVYDGHCGVCSRMAGVIRQWDRDGRMDVVASQADGVRERYPWISADAFRESLQVIGPGGERETTQGAAAVATVISLLPKGRWVAWLFRVPVLRPLAEWGYRLFARNRYRFGCGDHCSYKPRPPASPRR
jgi:predicted DCC family thiol-disulfide oxidoreductase YuxK